jgi:hypothetical protein
MICNMQGAEVYGIKVATTCMLLVRIQIQTLLTARVGSEA